jgi:fatty acid desaturase
MVIVLFLLIWTAAGYLIMTFPIWAVRIPLYVLIGIIMNGLTNLMHEAAHKNLFRDSFKDRFVGILLGVPSLVSYSAYRSSHLLHHRHNRTEKDPDEFQNISDNKKLLTVIYYFWLLAGTVIYIFYLPFSSYSKSPVNTRKSIIIEYLFIIVFWSLTWRLAVIFNFTEVLVQVWLIPVVIAILWVNIRYWSEHTQTQPGHPLTETRTVTSNPVFSFLNVNMNYHLEHHLYPGIPWYNLPELHRLLIPEYQKAGSSIYHSYIKFLIDAFINGPHGKSMGAGKKQ